VITQSRHKLEDLKKLAPIYWDLKLIALASTAFIFFIVGSLFLGVGQALFKGNLLPGYTWLVAPALFALAWFIYGFFGFGNRLFWLAADATGWYFLIKGQNESVCHVPWSDTYTVLKPNKHSITFELKMAVEIDSLPVPKYARFLKLDDNRTAIDFSTGVVGFVYKPGRKARELEELRLSAQ